MPMSVLWTLKCDLASSGICSVEYHRIKPWREEAPGKLLNTQGSPPPSSGAMHPKKRGSQAKTPGGLHG